MCRGTDIFGYAIALKILQPLCQRPIAVFRKMQYAVTAHGAVLCLDIVIQRFVDAVDLLYLVVNLMKHVFILANSANREPQGLKYFSQI